MPLPMFVLPLKWLVLPWQHKRLCQVQVGGRALTMSVLPWQRTEMYHLPHCGGHPQVALVCPPTAHCCLASHPPLPPAACEDEQPHPLPAPHGGPAHVLCGNLQVRVQGGGSTFGVLLHDTAWHARRGMARG